ncbi:hypothetical protein [Antarctobacter heliothermus]
MRSGPQNLITDVPCLLVGNAQDARNKSGGSVVTAEASTTAFVVVMGGASGPTECCLHSDNNYACFLSGATLTGVT